ncbi:unnamed protein product [Urochloa humidicola]
MEVARPPEGFLMPHQMIYHEMRRPAPPIPAPAATEQPRRVRMRTGPHEFYDGTMLTATRSVLGVVDGDAAAAASFAAWPMRRAPAAASAVAGLPETTAVGAGGGGEGEACCAVCLEGYALRTMPCAHAFHAACIVEWLSFGTFCPLCRFRLPTQAEDDTAQAQQPPPRLG